MYLLGARIYITYAYSVARAGICERLYGLYGILELRWAQFVDQGQHLDAASLNLNEGGSWSNYPFPHWRKDAIMGPVEFILNLLPLLVQAINITDQDSKMMTPAGLDKEGRNQPTRCTFKSNDVYVL
jgi:hypothetical protein